MAKVNPNDPTIQTTTRRIDSPVGPSVPASDVPVSGGSPALAPDIKGFQNLTRAGARPIGGRWTAGTDPVLTVAGVSRPVSKHLEASLDEMGPNLSLTELDGLRARHAV